MAPVAPGGSRRSLEPGGILDDHRLAVARAGGRRRTPRGRPGRRGRHRRRRDVGLGAGDLGRGHGGFRNLARDRPDGRRGGRGPRRLRPGRPSRHCRRHSTGGDRQAGGPAGPADPAVRALEAAGPRDGDRRSPGRRHPDVRAGPRHDHGIARRVDHDLGDGPRERHGRHGRLDPGPEGSRQGGSLRPLVRRPGRCREHGGNGGSPRALLVVVPPAAPTSPTQ